MSDITIIFVDLKKLLFKTDFTLTVFKLTFFGKFRVIIDFEK